MNLVVPNNPTVKNKVLVTVVLKRIEVVSFSDRPVSIELIKEVDLKEVDSRIVSIVNPGN